MDQTKTTTLLVLIIGMRGECLTCHTQGVDTVEMDHSSRVAYVTCYDCHSKEKKS